ncbi:MAG: glycosyltransferase family 2 protein [Spirochaetales bacterium]|nr:glycosyltransferase family 2 protein [Spirochaetales bacterium]
MNIIALIVTYNRLDLLKESIAALQVQTIKPNKILIYNNNSSDGTEDYLNTLNDELIIVKNATINTGGAGGFHHGIKMAYTLGANWAWVMDDDTIAEPGALEKLVESPFFPDDESENPTGYLAGRVDWTDGNRHLLNFIEPVHPWHHFHGKYENCYKITNSTFVSMLISRKAIEKVGLPVKEFFIWGDDWEYSGRISKQFNCYYISDSVVIHKTLENLESNVSNINKDNYWKYKFDARNSTSLKAGGFINFIKINLNLLSKINQMIKAKVKYRYILGYIFHSYRGLFFNYKKLVKFPKNL